MHAKSRLILKVLLNHVHNGREDSLLRRLPTHERDAPLQIEIGEGAPSTLVIDPSTFFSQLHYSWLPPLLKIVPSSLLPCYLCALPPSYRQPLARLLNIPQPTTALSPRVSKHLLNALYAKADDKPSLPVALLPPTPLSVLLSMDKAALTLLVDRLSMYDLADKIQRIVDKNRLKQIYTCLSVPQQKFLNTLLRKPHKIQLTEIDLSAWKEDPETLHNILHKRGLLRLAAAISGQHPDFLWHLTHRLDTGRAAIIKKHFSESAIPVYTPLLTEQLIDTIKYINRENAS